MATIDGPGDTWTQHRSRPSVTARSSYRLRVARLRRPLREQIARAALVQRSLLPDVDVPIGEFRLASLYWPCEMLGGDFYDIARRQDGGVLLAADVMGHGVEAALITMLVKAAFQEVATGTTDPGDLLSEMDDHLHRMVPPDHTFVATIDSSRGG